MAKKSSKKKPASRPAKPAARKPAAAKAKLAKPTTKPAPKPSKPAKAAPPAKPTVVAAAAPPAAKKPAGKSAAKAGKAPPSLEKPALAARTAAEEGRKGSSSLKTRAEPVPPTPTAKPPGSNGQHHNHEDRPPLTEDDLRKINSGLSKDDLQYFRGLLLEKRAEILGSVNGMEEARNSGAGEISHMPLHPADVGSDHFEQEFNLGLMESEKKLVREIDEALMRIQRGTYGVCVEAGKPIPRARLEITPWAKYCIEVVLEREKRGIR